MDLKKSMNLCEMKKKVNWLFIEQLFIANLLITFRNYYAK